MKAANLEKLLPGDVPEGERILWHGRPRFVALARRAYRVDFVAAYFAALTVWSLVYKADAGWLAAATAAAKTLGLGALAISLIALLAYLSARTTLYVVTTRRIVLKVGIALPLFINIPFSEIASASLRTFGDGIGEIPLKLVSGRRIGYWILWPHARPLRFTRPEPTMRCVGDAAAVAQALSRALEAASGQSSNPRPVARPSLVMPEHATA